LQLLSDEKIELKDIFAKNERSDTSVMKVAQDMVCNLINNRYFGGTLV